jgi:hypothetical protein
VIDAAAAFRAAGLGALVDAYQAPSPPAGPDSSSSGGPVVTAVQVTPTSDVVDDRPAAPKLRSASFRHRLMRVQVTRAPKGGTVIFKVAGRSYERSSGKLVLKTRSWRTTTVLVEDEWGVRSDSLKVRRPRRR